MTKRLPDAVFALYNSKTSTDSDGNTIDVIDLDNPVRKNNGAGEPVSFTTGSNGMITVEGDQDKDGWSIMGCMESLQSILITTATQTSKQPNYHRSSCGSVCSHCWHRV